MKKICSILLFICILLGSTACTSSISVHDYQPGTTWLPYEKAIYSVTYKNDAGVTIATGEMVLEIEQTTEGTPIQETGLDHAYIPGYIARMSFSLTETIDGKEYPTTIQSKILFHNNEGQVFQPIQNYRYMDGYTLERTATEYKHYTFAIQGNYSGNSYQATWTDILQDNATQNITINKIKTPYYDNEQFFYAVRAIVDLSVNYGTRFNIVNAVDQNIFSYTLTTGSSTQSLGIDTNQDGTLDEQYKTIYTKLEIASAMRGQPLELWVNSESLQGSKNVIVQIRQNSQVYRSVNGQNELRNVEVNYLLKEFQTQKQ